MSNKILQFEKKTHKIIWKQLYHRYNTVTINVTKSFLYSFQIPEIAMPTLFSCFENFGLFGNSDLYMK